MVIVPVEKNTVFFHAAKILVTKVVRDPDDLRFRFFLDGFQHGKVMAMLMKEESSFLMALAGAQPVSLIAAVPRWK